MAFERSLQPLRDQITKLQLEEQAASLGGAQFMEQLKAAEVDLETFFAQAPGMNPDARLITGVICGYRVEEITDPFMQKVRWADKLVDELARGKKMTSILRGEKVG